MQLSWLIVSAMIKYILHPAGNLQASEELVIGPHEYPHEFDILIHRERDMFERYNLPIVVAKVLRTFTGVKDGTN